MADRYHSHIYFDENTLEKARRFHQLHLENRRELQMGVSHLVMQNVGPHPLPMFEVHVLKSKYDDYVSFIENENPGLSILLHEDTGEDLKDHTTGARWFGKKLELDFGFFDLIQRDPSAKIHSDE